MDVFDYIAAGAGTAGCVINDMIYIRGLPWDFDGWQARMATSSRRRTSVDER